MKTRAKKTKKRAAPKHAGKAPRRNEQIVVAVSGGFDPVHIGHVRMINEARKLGDRLVVILNNDNWLRAKKGYVFMPEHERKEVIEAFEAVDEVIVTSHPEDPADMSVCDALVEVRPHIFANGGDRTNKNVPEIPICEQIRCRMVYNVGQGGKVQSSSWLVGKAQETKKLAPSKGAVKGRAPKA